MAALGYDRFCVQGGDYGSFIGPLMASLAPERVIGVHVNAVAFGFMPGKGLAEEELATMTDIERDRVARSQEWSAEKAGYFKLQGTRPQTLSYGLTDSPAGQLAWIVEKFKEWTDAAKELPDDAVPRDRLLANVSVYWFTGTAGSSANLYYETTHARAMPSPSGVPTGVAVFAEDLAHPASRREVAQRHPLERLRHRRALRRDGDAAAARRGHPEVLRDGDVNRGFGAETRAQRSPARRNR